VAPPAPLNGLNYVHSLVLSTPWLNNATKFGRNRLGIAITKEILESLEGGLLRFRRV